MDISIKLAEVVKHETTGKMLEIHGSVLSCNRLVLVIDGSDNGEGTMAIELDRLELITALEKF